jgi:hypothetical protein
MTSQFVEPFHGYLLRIQRFFSVKSWHDRFTSLTASTFYRPTASITYFVLTPEAAGHTSINFAHTFKEWLPLPPSPHPIGPMEPYAKSSPIWTVVFGLKLTWYNLTATNQSVVVHNSCTIQSLQYDKSLLTNNACITFSSARRLVS